MWATLASVPYYHLQGYAQVFQTALLMIVALLSMVTYGRRAYSSRGWWIRFLVMVATFFVLGAADLWLNEGAGGELDNGIGTGLHYNLLIVVALITLGTFLATFRAIVKNPTDAASEPAT